MTSVATDLLPISALQHLIFCERQCALIHVERLWAENRLTVEGRLLHRKAHNDMRPINRPGVRTTRGLELVSHRLGLFGVSDVIEWKPEHPPFPIEYKRGKPKAHSADRVQLCAQAMCLEEMLGVPDSAIAAGAIFYGKTRRRFDVLFDASLRLLTAQAASRLHEIISSGATPTARREPKCEQCSLLNLCLPDALRPRLTARNYLSRAAERSLAQHEADLS